MNIMKLSLYLLCMIFAVMLSSCGFHTRSANDLPVGLKNLTLITAENSTPNNNNLKALLAQQLQALGVNLTPHSPISLIIVNEKFSPFLSRLGTAQQLNSIDLYYTVTYQLKNADQKILSETSLTTHTTYLENANQILADTRRIPLLQQELVQQMVSQIISHLSAVDTHRAVSD